jgi:hypothetical protein
MGCGRAGLESGREGARENGAVERGWRGVGGAVSQADSPIVCGTQPVSLIRPANSHFWLCLVLGRKAIHEVGDL